MSIGSHMAVWYIMRFVRTYVCIDYVWRYTGICAMGCGHPDRASFMWQNAYAFFFSTCGIFIQSQIIVFCLGWRVSSLLVLLIVYTFSEPSHAGTPAHKLHPRPNSPGQALNALIPSDHPPSLADTNTFFRSHVTPPLPAPSLALPQHSWSLPDFSSTDWKPLRGKERVWLT